MSWLTNTWNSFTKGAEKTFDTVKDGVEDIANETAKSAEKTFDTVKDGVEDIANETAKSVEKTFDSMEDAVDDIVGDITDGVEDVAEETIDKLKIAANEAEKELKKIGYLAEEIFDIMRNAGEKIAQWSKTIIDGEAYKKPFLYLSHLPDTKISAMDYASLCKNAYKYKKYQNHEDYKLLLGTRTYKLAKEQDYINIGLHDCFQYQTARDGFQIAIYKYEENQQQQYVIVFVGTGDSEDWKFNVFSTLGIDNFAPTGYIKTTLKIGAAMKKRNDVTITGHSLGAALAYIAASVARKEAVIFNGFMPNLLWKEKIKFLPYSRSNQAIYHYCVDSEILHLLRKMGILDSPSVKKYIVLDANRLKKPEHKKFKSIPVDKERESEIQILVSMLAILIPVASLHPLFRMIALAVLMDGGIRSTFNVFSLALKRHDIDAVIACLEERQTYERSSQISPNIQIIVKAMRKGNADMRRSINKIVVK